MVMQKNAAFLRTCSLLFALISVSACVTTTTTYVAPSGPTTAKLQIKTDALQSHAYSISIFDDAVNCTNPKLVAVGQGSSSNLTTSLKTGALVTTRFVGAGNSKTCQILETFVPISGHTYQLHGKLDEQGCSVVVYDVSNPNNPQVEQSLLRRQVKNQTCEPLSAAKRIVAVVKDSKPSMDDFVDLLPGK